MYACFIVQIANCGSLKEVKRAAELLGLSDLLVALDSFTKGELYLSAQVEKQIHDTRQARLRTLALSPDNFLTGESAHLSLCLSLTHVANTPAHTHTHTHTHTHLHTYPYTCTHFHASHTYTHWSGTLGCGCVWQWKQLHSHNCCPVPVSVHPVVQTEQKRKARKVSQQCIRRLCLLLSSQMYCFRWMMDRLRLIWTR